jgi:hypothetical protein
LLQNLTSQSSNNLRRTPTPIRSAFAFISRYRVRHRSREYPKTDNVATLNVASDVLCATSLWEDALRHQKRITHCGTTFGIVLPLPSARCPPTFYLPSKNWQLSCFGD